MNVTTYYLQMFERPPQPLSPPPEGFAVVHAQKPTVAYYRFLYHAVGGEYEWTSRKRLSDDGLAAILNDPRDEVHVLMTQGVPAGFAEIDRRVAGQIELVQFGLMRPFIGRGLGKWFLRWVIDKAWSYNPKRFWLHTCTKDHPAALPNYLQAGFTLYNQVVKDDRASPAGDLQVQTIVETALYVDDLVAAGAFYRDILGLRVIAQENGRHVFFQVGNAQVLLAFIAQATLKGDVLPAHGASGAGHFALGIQRPELDAWRQHLQDHGIAIEKEVQWPPGGQSLYFRDPAGNLVELITPGIWGLPSGW